MRPAERVARLLLVAAWMGLVIFWSGQSNLPIDQPLVADVLHGFQHRAAHQVAFGLLGLLASWAFAGVPRAAVWAVVLTSAFGATDEWHQSFTAGRHSGIDDWAWDTACAVIALYVWERLRTSRWHVVVRRLAPLAVAAAFAVGLGLAIGRALPPPGDVTSTTVRAVTVEAAHSAIQFARLTRNAARQIRSTVGG